MTHGLFCRGPHLIHGLFGHAWTGFYTEKIAITTSEMIESEPVIWYVKENGPRKGSKQQNLGILKLTHGLKTLGKPKSTLGAFRKGADGGVVPYGPEVTLFQMYDVIFEDRRKREKQKKKPKKGATRGLPGRSPILVLLSPKHA